MFESVDNLVVGFTSMASCSRGDKISNFHIKHFWQKLLISPRVFLNLTIQERLLIQDSLITE